VSFYRTIRPPFFGISIDALRIAGGIIIVRFSATFRKFTKKRGINKKAETDAQQRNDIALTPLAIPIAGPGSISLLIAFYQEHNTWKLLFPRLRFLPLQLPFYHSKKCSLSR
jgi:multiple antibiotic resistance protein